MSNHRWFAIAGAVFLAAGCRSALPTTALVSPSPSEAGGPAPVSTSASPASAPMLPVIFDDDGSPDGTTALLYLLSHPSVDLRGASVSFGEAYPQTYIQHFGRLIDAYGEAAVPLGAGEAAPLAGHNMFPEGMRLAANDFWGFPLPHPDRTYPAEDAAHMMVSVVSSSQEPVTIFISGPATNLAQALRQEPDMAGNIQAVVMMGGAVHVPGNIHDLIRDSENEVAEWNVYADPQAAREVLASGVPIVMVPLDATNQVSVDRDDTSGWQDGGPGADLAAEIYDSLMSNWGTDQVAIWDLMTAAIMTDPALCKFEDLALDVITADGPTSGQTVIVPGGQPNVSVCLEPDVAGIKQTLVEVFSSGG